MELNDENGFTFMEILIVVVIISLLVAIVGPRLIGQTHEAKKAAVKQQIGNFETALKLFKIDNGFYPSTDQGLEALVEKPTTGREPKSYRERGYMEKSNIPMDPWKNPYIYISPGLHDDYDIFSYGADGDEGGEGEDADITSWEVE